MYMISMDRWLAHVHSMNLESRTCISVPRDLHILECMMLCVPFSSLYHPAMLKIPNLLNSESMMLCKHGDVLRGGLNGNCDDRDDDRGPEQRWALSNDVGDLAPCQAG